MSKENLVPDSALKPFSIYIEHDLMECARDKICRKIEADGERALELALAEIGFVRERTCHNTEHMDGCFACSVCGEGLEDPRQEPNFVKWCPFCGAKVMTDEH